MLTIDKEVLGRVRLKVPNYVIKGMYFEYFLKKLNEDISCKIDVDEIQDAIEQIALEGTNAKFIKLIENAVSELSKRDFIKRVCCTDEFEKMGCYICRGAMCSKYGSAGVN